MIEHNNQNKLFFVGKASPVENRGRIANTEAVPPKIWVAFLIVALFLSGGLGSCANRTTQSTSTGESTDPAVSPASNSSAPTNPNGGSPTMGNGQGMTTGQVDKQFIAMMVPHHEQAIQMDDSRFVRPELRELARSIVKTQTAEIGQMQKWYQTWYKSAP